MEHAIGRICWFGFFKTRCAQADQYSLQPLQMQIWWQSKITRSTRFNHHQDWLCADKDGGDRRPGRHGQQWGECHMGRRARWSVTSSIIGNFNIQANCRKLKKYFPTLITFINFMAVTKGEEGNQESVGANQEELLIEVNTWISGLACVH